MTRLKTNPAAFIYGLITVGTLLAAESARQETYARTIVAVAIAMALYWLAHGYASFTAQRLREGEPIELPELARTMAHESPLLLGGLPPLLAVSIAGIAGARLTDGVSAAIWTDVAMIVAIEFLAAVRTEKRGRDLLLQTLMGIVLGVLIIVLRLVLH